MSTGEQENVRRSKLETIRKELHIDPYPSRCLPRSSIAEVRDGGETEEELVICGRVSARREHGKTVFAEVTDASGTIQVYLNVKVLDEEAWELTGLLDLGDIVQVRGSVFNTRTGELTIRCEGLAMLCKSLRTLPVVKVDSEGTVHDKVSDVDYLYRHRCVDLLVNPSSMARFRARSGIISALRSYLDSRGFLEVETPVLQPIYGGAAAQPFTTEYGSMNETFYLRIATELYLKRLLTGGIEKVYELGKDFRNEGVDRTHSPEFTQLELYEAYSDYSGMMTRFEEMTRAAADALGTGLQVSFLGQELDLSAPFRRLAFVPALREGSGEDLMSWEPSDLKDLCSRIGIESTATDRASLIDKLFDHFVADRIKEPTFVVDYPALLSPLAKHKAGEPGITERFEVFVMGLELANAFSEQNDPDLQREILGRQAASSELREGILDEEFLFALETGMPPAGGMGIDVDRLVMLLTDAGSIRETILFPHLRRSEE